MITARPLDEAALLSLWEWGRGRHDVERAVGVVVASTGLAWAEAVTLPLGERDAVLLDVHMATFGPRIVATARCPECAEKSELTVECAHIRLAPSPRGPHRLPGERELVVVLPDSLALAATASLPLDEARDALLRRCVVAPADPTRDELDRVSAALPELDAQADIRFAIACAACSHAWTSCFAVDRFVWARVEEHGQRLLRDVLRLARAFHWSEADILTMSPQRRQAYLELCADA